MKKTTIKDVAEKAGVSPSTVSRVISNSSNISEDTKKNVRKIMDKLNYHPNAIARSLVKQKSNTLGLVMSRPADRAFANPFFSEIIQGIATIAKSNHFSLLISTAEDHHQESEEAIKLVKNGRADGLILMASRKNDKLIDELLAFNCPFVLIGRSPDHKNIPRVDNDNIRASYNLINYLIKKDYRNIGVISGPREYMVSQDRLTGYKKALHDNNIEIKKQLICFSDFSYQSGYKAAAKLLNVNNDIEIVFAFDDLLALAALRYYKDKGLAIPDDIGIVGFNDEPLSTYIEPSLTTVKIPIIEMGKKAAKMLIDIINKPDYQGKQLILPTEIIERKSVI